MFATALIYIAVLRAGGRLEGEPGFAPFLDRPKGIEPLRFAGAAYDMDRHVRRRQRFP